MTEIWARRKISTYFLFSSILVTIASIQMFLSVRITSDSTFEYDLARSIWSGGSYFDWSLSPAPSFFPDLFFAFLLYPLGIPLTLFNFVISITQLLMLFLVLSRLFSKLNSKLPAEMILLIAGLMSLSNTYGLWFLFHSTNDHLGSVIIGIYAVSLLIQDSFNTKDFFKLGLSSFLGVITTSLSFISFILPLLAFQILSLKSRKYRDKNGFRNLTSILLGTGSGLLMLRFMNPNPRIDARIRIGNDFARQGIENFLLAINYVFDSTRLPLFLSSLMLCFVVVMAVLVSLNKIFFESFDRDSSIFNLNLIYVLTFFINTPFAIISGSFNDVWGFRYLYMPIFLSVVVLLQTKDVLANRSPGIFFRRSGFYLAALIVLFSMARFDSRSANNQNQQISEVAVCVQALRDRGEISGAGISDYWHARAVTLLTREKIQIEAMTSDLQPFFWMFTFDSLKLPYYDFVLSTKEGTNDPFNFVASSMKDLPGSFYKVDCKNTTKEILVYKDGSLNNLIQARNSAFLASIK